jgi:hypothetical protein
MRAPSNRLVTRLVSLWLALPLLGVLPACYGLIGPVDEAAWDPFGPDEAGQPVEQELLELQPDDLFDEAAQRHGVPSDLLRAIGSVASGFAMLDGGQDASVAKHGWMGLSAPQVELGAELAELRPSDVRDERTANVLAAAAVLADLRDLLAPEAEPTMPGADWWHVVAEYSELDEPWMADAWTAEVFATMQRGLVAATSQLDAEYVVIAPMAIPGLASLDVLPPPLGAELPDAPSVARLLESPNRVDRAAGTGSIQRVVLHAVEGAWIDGIATSLDPSSGWSAHYVVRRSDGEVTQLVRDGKAALHSGSSAHDGDTIAIAIGGGSDSPGSWTPAALEASAWLAAWLVQRHDIPIDRDHFVGHDELDGGAPHPGDYFPWSAWLDAVACFVGGGGSECAGMAGGPDPDAEFPGLGGDGARSVPDVPYFYQYGNTLHPGSSCQNTAIAMVLRHVGWSGDPDTITARFGKDLAQSPAGLVQVFNTLTEEAGLSARLVAHTDGTISGFRALLAQGKPVIVNGYFTGSGHVLVTLAYEGGQYVVNDPAGKWAQTFKGGYPYGWSSIAGKKIRYAAGPYEDAISLNSSGTGSLPLWYYELVGVGASELPSDDASDPGDEDTGTPDPDDGGSHTPEPTPDPSDGSGVDGTPDPLYPWGSIELTAPSHGETVSNPVTLRSFRGGGTHTEYWAGPWKLAPDLVDEPAQATVLFHTLGTRTLTAKNISAWGTVLAEHSIVVDIEHADPVEPGPAAQECWVEGAIACGQTVSGDTTQGSDVIDGYPDIVGSWSGMEQGWSWVGSGGEVEIAFIDPEPTAVDLDIIVLRRDQGVCVAPDVETWGGNSVAFESVGGASYTFVVDGYDGDVGAYQLALDCGS